jgi:hypothetical protein
MKRIALLIALAMGLAGCGSENDGPAVPAVTVTVQYLAATVPATPVVMSSGIQNSSDPAVPPTPTGILATQNTDTTGKITFTVPGSTSTGSLCFSSLIQRTGGFSFAQDCRTLNLLQASELLNHDQPR